MRAHRPSEPAPRPLHPCWEQLIAETVDVVDRARAAIGDRGVPGFAHLRWLDRGVERDVVLGWADAHGDRVDVLDGRRGRPAARGVVLLEHLLDYDRRGELSAIVTPEGVLRRRGATWSLSLRAPAEGRARAA
jgi:hypothetical protein